MLKIPKIIHQIYDSREGNKISHKLIKISKTWEKNHSQWKYLFWDQKAIDAFLEEHYPYYIAPYFHFKYPVQRWDSIRYLLVYHYGGLYVDMDYESLEPLDKLLDNAECFFGCEPVEHKPSDIQIYLGNSLFGSIAEHPFLQLLIKKCFEPTTEVTETNGKIKFILETTGPVMVSKMYQKYANNKKVTLLPSEFVAPWTLSEAHFMLSGNYTQKMEDKLEKAYCVHYFFGSWL